MNNSFINGIPLQHLNKASQDIGSMTPIITHTLKSKYEEAGKAAIYDEANVLITGESGTGKELIARYIQKLSPRKQRPYVELNIGINSGELINSDLFGHIKGSYTGATYYRAGFFAKADKGTILLDEIGEAPMDVQINLLRVIQEGTFYPVGSDEEKKTNVRIISATNASLKNKIMNGSFREDLYYRISDFEIELPPLRKYPKSELKEIFEYFLTDTAKKINKRAPWIKTDAWDKILNYQFKGNFRDLSRIVKRIFISQKVEINENDLIGILNENEISVPKTMDDIKKIITPYDYQTQTSQESNTDSAINADADNKPFTMDEHMALKVYEIVKKHNGVKKYAAKEFGKDTKTVNRYLAIYESMGKIPDAIGKNPNDDRKKSNPNSKNLRK